MAGTGESWDDVGKYIRNFCVDRMARNQDVYLMYYSTGRSPSPIPLTVRPMSWTALTTLPAAKCS